MSGPKPLEGFGGRLRSTAKIAATGARLASRRLFGREGEPDARLGDALARELDRMKGMAMKAGQILSYFDGILPEATHEALRVLQTGATRLSWDRVAALVESELGRPIPELFDDFEREPAASASIGQVHRASVAGRPVAVKVQYPGVADLIDADLARLRPLTRLVSIGTAVDGPAIADDLAERLAEECDYRAEARNQSAFRRAFADDDRISIPRVCEPLSTRRILTMEWADGRSFYRFAREASQDDRDAAARVLLRFAYRGLFELHTVNADPHPGNYLFPAACPERAPIVFLDFGCVHRFTAEFIEAERAVARAVLDDRRGDFDGLFRRTGMVAREGGFDYDVQWRMYRLQYRPFRDPSFTYTTDFMKEVMELSGPSNPNLRRLAVSHEWVWLQRLVWGLHAVLARLGGRGPFGPLLREILARDPRPAAFDAGPDPAPGGTPR